MVSAKTEYTILCPKSIVARVLTVQILDTTPRALSFDEITVIKQSFLNGEDDQARPESYNGSPGNSNLIVNYDLLEYDFMARKGKLWMFLTSTFYKVYPRGTALFRGGTSTVTH